MIVYEIIGGLLVGGLIIMGIIWASQNIYIKTGDCNEDNNDRFDDRHRDRDIPSHNDPVR